MPTVFNPTFALTQSGIDAINGLGVTTVAVARSCGVSSGELVSALAGDPFILRLQQRLMLLTTRVGVSLEDGFSQVS